ncbi:MAG TPA: RNA-binding protein [Puia sp.]|nr:RNA-binding protein [Puia sp.]
MNMYVSNLGFQVTNEELASLFEKFGEVTSAKVITDRETGRSRGFAFVEMEDKAAELAMKGLDGTELDGRAISVTKAKPKTENKNSSFSRDRGNRW